MKTIKDLYDMIVKNYGARGCWVSELAEKLKISYEDANYLTRALGYHRGRAVQVVSYSNFESDAGEY